MNGNTIGKKVMLTARIPQETMYAIDEFQRKHNIDFRTDAIIEIVKVACTAVGIDPSNIPKPQVEPIIETQDENIQKIVCPKTHKKGGMTRCETCYNKDRERWNNCPAIPKAWRESILFAYGEEEKEEFAEEETEEETEQPTETIDTITTKPKEEKRPTSTEQKTNVSMFTGYIYCPKEKKLVDPSKCIERCPNPLDREACKEEREKRSK